MFQAFATTAFSQSYLAIVATVFMTCLILLGVAILAVRLLKIDNPFAPALFTGFETGMIGYALYLAVFGQSEVYRLAIVDLGQVTFVFFVLVTYISRQNGNRTSGWQLIRSFLLSPVILAILLGILASLTGLGTLLETTRGGQMVATTVQLLGNLTVPLITIAIGFELHLGRETLKAPLLAALVRILVLFALATLINKVLIRDLLHLEPQFETALMTLFLLPPPSSSPFSCVRSARAPSICAGHTLDPHHPVTGRIHFGDWLIRNLHIFNPSVFMSGNMVYGHRGIRYI